MDKKDSVHVLSITDVSKDYLDKKFLPMNILALYKTHCIGRFPHERFDIHMTERKTNCDVKEQIVQSARKYEANYIVIGGFGRKGEKEDPYRVGNTTLHIIEKSRVPLILIKKPYQRAKNETKGFNFLIAVDGSKTSFSLAKVAKDMARNSNDKIYAVSITEEFSIGREQMETEFREHCNISKVPLEDFWIVDKASPEDKVPETLNNWANQSEKILYDFILIGGNGCEAQRQNRYFMGKVLSYIIKKTVLNVIVVP